MDQSQNVSLINTPNTKCYQINNVLFSIHNKSQVDLMISEWEMKQTPIYSPNIVDIDPTNYSEWKMWLWSIPDTTCDFDQDIRNLEDTNVWQKLKTNKGKDIPVYFASDLKSAENALYWLMDKDHDEFT